MTKNLVSPSYVLMFLILPNIFFQKVDVFNICFVVEIHSNPSSIGKDKMFWFIRILSSDIRCKRSVL